MTTDSDSECSYVANLADFNVIRVIIIVIVIKIIVIKIIVKRVIIVIEQFIQYLCIKRSIFKKHLKTYLFNI